MGTDKNKPARTPILSTFGKKVNHFPESGRKTGIFRTKKMKTRIPPDPPTARRLILTDDWRKVKKNAMETGSSSGKHTRCSVKIVVNSFSTGNPCFQTEKTLQ
ncbi:MAG TPA: hypothetical protein DEB39_07770 [Planctomycetaceae bacterium]|nr:hypothetical protein [Planctomycetaceae bacterium]